jgi:hypothetical protein
MSIARGTVPLALFGAPGYAVLMGQVAAPSSLAQAISPLLGALVLESGGPTEILFALSGVALANVMLVRLLTLVSKPLVSELRRSRPTWRQLIERSPTGPRVLEEH